MVFAFRWPWMYAFADFSDMAAMPDLLSDTPG